MFYLVYALLSCLLGAVRLFHHPARSSAHEGLNLMLCKRMMDGPSATQGSW